MIQVVDKQKCVGCSACYSICPKHCIEMKEDNEGFEYPFVNEDACINCGLCEKVCPMLVDATCAHRKTKAYIAQNSDEGIRKLSTSGGMFSALAFSIIECGGCVFAAGYDGDMAVKHKKADNTANLEEMYGSKYVQSYLGDTFVDVKNELAKHIPVLFVGTPCQVDGLINYIGSTNSEYLYTADFACYGVPSPGIYKRWIESLEKQYGKKITCIYFRDKKYGYAGVNTKIVFENGNVLEDKKEAKTFLKTMFSHIGLRPSCYKCKYRAAEKRCDFTLSDVWDIGQHNQSMDDDKGTTLIKIHTEKGMQLFEGISDKVKFHDVTDALAENEKKEYVIDIPADRDAFFSDAQDMPYDKLIDKYLPFSVKDRAACFLKPIIVKLPFSNVFFRKLKDMKRKKK